MAVSRTPLVGALVVAAMATSVASAAGPPVKLRKLSSRYYSILTNLPRQEALEIGRHMDAVYTVYDQRFRSFRRKKHTRFPLYLFETEQQYRSYLIEQGFDPGMTAGLFFVLPGKAQGLAAWTENKSRGQLYRILQHEGFHQFAYTYIGKNLPVWVNEGLAEYFGDGILIRNVIHLGQTGEDRLAYVERSVRNDESVPFAEMLEMTDAEWFQKANGSAEDAARLYSQAWSMVHFLVHAENERFQGAFANYLSLLGDGQTSRRAFQKAFGTTRPEPFEQRWKQYALSVEPEPLSAAVSRLEFFGQGLRFLHDNGIAPPRNFDELRGKLRAVRFELTRYQYGGKSVISAEDETLYSVAGIGGRPARFVLGRPAADGLPASITVRGVRPVPTLTWTRGAQGRLVDEITFK